MLENLSLGLSTTAVGMLVVFAGLVILIACISIMGMLNKNSGTRKKSAAPKAAPPPPAKVDAPPAVVALPAQQESDEQLIAVITAAIAAVWQGEQSGFVVRRVRRTDGMSARARAAREEQIYTHL
ncbi:MAG: OadG family protein [Clostridia bacterium]|nr:OadG family protein [Clostridia bacterium]